MASAGGTGSRVLESDSVGCTAVGISGGVPSAESVDYVNTKTQFQLHTLLTEQRHKKTMNMSQTISQNAEDGLKQLLSVDEDITDKINALLADSNAVATLASIQAAFQRTIVTHRKTYIYGCGATGRLAKLMESTFWRPFWRRIKESSHWARIAPHVSQTIEDDMIGEMTGADRALISSLEGFEDLLVIGELQLKDRGVTKGDLVIGVTEGGETSSVIGTVLAGLKQWTEDTDASKKTTESEIREHLFFVYNNPDAVLMPFHRSASVINEPCVQKLNLSTGPQAITGSTRMQATTSETFVLASALHVALDAFLRETVGLDGAAMQSLGFGYAPVDLKTKLQEFPSILSSVQSATGYLSTFTRWEASCYSNHHFTSYFAERGLMTVFIDSTERSPTFRLFALDTTQMTEQRKAWIQVWTSAQSCEVAWVSFLGRKFRGLEKEFYQPRFEGEIADPYLKATALRSLPNAGKDQEALYDFSFSPQNRQRAGGVKAGDVGCLTLMDQEVESLKDPESSPSQFVRLFTALPEANDTIKSPTRCNILVFHSTLTKGDVVSVLQQQNLPMDRINVVVIQNQSADDPLGIRAQMAMKIALNAHSTGVMSILGKVLGNCMVNVSPGNLKLIGRATFLILSHVNHSCEKAGLPQVSYALANAVLYDSISVIKADQARHGSNVPSGGAGGQSAEVALSIVRILQSLGDGKPISGEQGLSLLAEKGLEKFLVEFDAKYGKK